MADAIVGLFKCCPEFESNTHKHMYDKHMGKASMFVRPYVRFACIYFTFEITRLILRALSVKVAHEIHLHSCGSIVNPNLNEAHNEFCQFSQSCSLYEKSTHYTYVCIHNFYLQLF
jgi:hypothetical protein